MSASPSVPGPTLMLSILGLRSSISASPTLSPMATATETAMQRSPAEP